MKATELRIGNFVLYQDTNHTKSSRSKTEPIEVESVWYNGINIESGYEGTIECGIDEENITGIPLTPEILEKCGFERNGSFFEKDSVQIMWGYDNEKGNWFHYTVDELVQYSYFKYVHQLQNLYFALTQTELNYKP